MAITVKEASVMHIRGRLMVMLSRRGLTCGRCLRLYLDAVSAAVAQQLGGRENPPPRVVEATIEDQLALLDEALGERACRSPKAAESVQALPAEASDVRGVADKGMAAATSTESGQREPSGYVPPARSMEEKLRDGRETLQKLLFEDCVSAGLLDRARAQSLVDNMTGKTCEAAEVEIVGVLREKLQSQVRSLIRKRKAGPWSSPLAQADLYQDIQRAKSVRGVITLTRQIMRERRTWEVENGGGGLRGLFGSWR